MTAYIKSSIKLIVFDHDDTLVGTIKAKWAQHKHVARTYYKKHLTDEEIRQHWGKPFSLLVGLLYGTDDIDQAMANNKATHTAFPKILRDDTIEVLKFFHAAGKKLGVITSTSSYSFNYDLDSLGIPRELFEFVQTEEDTKFHKPDPRVFDPVLSWLKKENIQPKEVVYVGDSLHDMQAALGAGFEFIGVTTGLVTQAEFKRNKATAINRLSDLIKT